MTAPVCPVSRSQIPSGQPGTMLPFVSRPVDLPSAIAAANQINRILQQFGQPVFNNVYPAQSSGTPEQGDKGIKKKQSRWREKKGSRHTEKVKYHNPEDDQIWVEVERITKITWEDTGWGTELTFEYGAGTEI